MFSRNSISRIFPVLLVVVTLIFSLFTPSTIAHAATTFIVNSAADAVDAAPGNGVCATAGGVCTLRAAIQEANALAGDDTITLAGTTYTLTIAGAGEDNAATGDLDIKSNITINGAGAGSTFIQAGDLGVGGPPNGIDRVFHVVLGGKIVNISGVTVRNGNSADQGGGIYNNASTLTITNSTISGNSTNSGGGGIYNSGSLSITNSAFSNNRANSDGGGIYNDTGTLAIMNSYFSGNIASGGGGIFNNGPATITNSTFFDNSANNGGGFYANADTLTITNSTISGNSATAAGGGINRNSGTVTLRNTIVANNTTGGNCSGTITNGGNNIDDGISCGLGSASGSMSSTDPLLGSLADNGGPTQTFALLPGSPAVDAGNDSTCASFPVSNLDQRGFPRPRGVHCDIGAYERSLRYVATTGSNAGSNNCTNSLSPCLTISYAIGKAVSGDAIYIATGTYAEFSIPMGGFEIIGAGMNQTILYGGGSNTVAFVGTGKTTSVADLTIQNGNYSGDGGGIVSDGPLTLKRVKITGNHSSGSGGGIIAYSALTMTDSVVSANTAALGGGGIFIGTSVLATAINLTNVTISGNTATGWYDGGVHIQGSPTVNFTNVTISGNTAPSPGGFSVTAGTIINILNSTITNNHLTSGTVGGIVNYGTLTIKNTIIAGNDGDECSPGGTWTSQGYNLSSDATCSFTNTGDQQSADPLLGPLANNGGSTQTHALWTGSPAIDTGTNSGCPSKDQRGFTRPQDGNLDATATCDIGSYELIQPATTFGPISQWTSAFDLSHGWTVQNFVRTVGDVNNDQRADLIGFGQDGVYVALSTGTGFGAISQWTSAFDLSHGWTVQDFVRTVGDVNNDGRADLVGFGADGVYVALSTGTGFGAVAQWSTSFGLANGWTVQNYVRTVGDVNNDGRADLVGFGLDGVYVALSTGTGFGAVSQWSTGFGLANGWTVQSFVRTLGDVNNDGRADLIGFGADGVYVALAPSTGTAFGPVAQWSTGFGLANGWTVQSFVRTVGDVNNDGRADLIGFGADGVYVATSDGAQFGVISKWTSAFDLSHGWTVKDFVRTVGDVNNDGQADLIGFGLDGVYVALSDGTQFGAISKWTSAFDLSHGWTVQSFVRTVGDVSGDGNADLVGFGLDGVYVAIAQ